MKLVVNTEIELDKLSVDDTPVIYDLIEKNRAHLSEYLYWLDEVQCLESAQTYVSERANSDKPGALWFKIKVAGKVVGIFGVKSVCKFAHKAEIGYWLTQDAQGKGVITQSIHKVCEHLRSVGVNNVDITCLEANTASIAVAKRANAIQTDTKPKYAWMADRWQDLHIFTIHL